MELEFEKRMRVISDILSFCNLKGANEFHVDLTNGNREATFDFKASPVTISDKDVGILKKELDAPRSKEMEENYWELMGGTDNFSQLTLVGMMCDEANIACEDNVLNIVLKRYN